MSRSLLVALGLLVAGLACTLWLVGERGARSLAIEPESGAAQETAAVEVQEPGAAPAPADATSQRTALEERPPAMRAPQDGAPLPEATAQLHGRVVLPPGKTKENPAGLQITCATLPGAVRVREAIPGGGFVLEPSSSTALEVDFAQVRSFNAHTDGGGAFEFESLPAGVALQLGAYNPWGVDWSQPLAALAAGERREVVIALDTGVRVSGRVVDEHGSPAAGLTVQLREVIDGETGSFSPTRSGRTDDRGRFEVVHLPRRSWKVEVQDSDLAVGSETYADTTAGDVRGLELSVVRGGCIEGTVVWPDGRAAESFTLMAWGPRVVVSGDFEGGHFEQCRIADGAYELVVGAEEGGVRGEARLKDVHQGDRGLRLVLDTHVVFAIHGTVVDAAHAPVKRFTVEASTSSDWRSEEGKDGELFLDGLTAGEWDVEVRAPDLLSAVQRVVVEPNTPPVSFVLTAAGRIRGTVLDARGQPVRAVVGAQGGRIRRFDSDDNVTGADGRFDIAASSSQMCLFAQSAGHAQSETVELSVAPGEIVDGVVLRLREACRLEGRVVDADGKPVEEAWVHAAVGVEPPAGVRPDARGRFAFAALPPGRVLVRAEHEDRQACAGATVTLDPGAATTVELRFERSDPVKVRGRIVRGARPFVGSILFNTRGGTATAETGADGRFETTLRSPGTWRIAVGLGGVELRVEDVRVLDLVVPDEESFEVELDVERMRAIQSLEELGY